MLPPGCSEPEIFDIPPEAAFTMFWSPLCCYVITVFYFCLGFTLGSFLHPVGLTSGLHAVLMHVCYLIFTHRVYKINSNKQSLIVF